MHIRRTRTEDLPALLRLYETARIFMAQNGNPDQWSGGYPAPELLERDIAEDCGYLCEEDGQIAAAFCFRPGPDPTYGIIENGAWLNDDPYFVVHRIASAARGRGIAAFCLDWCFDRCGNLRIDTYRDNAPTLSLLPKLGFIRCGTIYLENGDDRIAFQKIKPVHTGMQEA